MADTLLIDGNNLIHQVPALNALRQRAHQLAVEALIHWLEPLVMHDGYQIVLVLDGVLLPEEETFLDSPVQVIYSGRDQTADAVIERMVYRTQVPSEVVVVTTDRALGQFVVGKGARCWSTQQFESLLPPRQGPSGQAGWWPAMFVVAALVLGGASLAKAQKVDDPTEQRIEETEERPTMAPRKMTVEEVVEALKARARAIVEARKPTLWRLQGLLAHTVGYENNANLDTARQGDYFNLTDTSLTLALNHWRPLEALLGYAMSAYLYWEYRDNSYVSNTPSVKLRWRAVETIRLEGSFEWEDLTYFDNIRSSLDNFRYHTNVRHTISETAYHQFGFQYLWRPYETREARGGFGQRTFQEREDQRHTGSYEVGVILPGNGFLRLKNEWSKHSSNDALEDFYDYQVFRVRASVFGPITETWSLNGSFSYEGKHYKDRNVPNANVAERDDTYTWTVGATCQFTKAQSAAYTWQYKELLSNDPRQEYVNTIHQLAYNFTF